MPQYVNFQQFPNAPFKFQILVDGFQWSVIVTWNVASQRWYLNFYDDKGNWIVTIPLIESIPGWALETLTFDPNRLIMIATLSKPHNKKLGQVVRCLLIGSDNTTLNGWHDCLVETSITLSFPVASNPGLVNPPGTLNSAYNLIDKYALTTTLLFRNKLFEVYP